jgi:hypothetical protein
MNSEGGNWTLKCVQIATIPSDDDIMLCSIVASHTAATAFRAAMNTSSAVEFRCEGFEGYYVRKPKKLRGQGMYNTATHRLGYDMVQVTVWAKDSGFLACISDEGLWQTLRRECTTPIKRDWIPWIRNRLEECRGLKKCYAANCKCGVLLAGTTKLDEIVSRGLEGREIYV